MTSSRKFSSASSSASEDPVLYALIQTEGEISSKIQIIQIHLHASRVNFIMYYKTKAVNSFVLRAAGIGATVKICQSCTTKFLTLAFPSGASRHCGEQIAPVWLQQPDLVQSKGCNH